VIPFRLDSSLRWICFLPFLAGWDEKFCGQFKKNAYLIFSKTVRAVQLLRGINGRFYPLFSSQIKREI